jgi:Holliday junction resolvase
MARASSEKGVRGEREVRDVWERHGFSVRGLEGQGDHLVMGYGIVIASEVKRCERLAIPAWWRQTETDAAEHGALPVLAFRTNKQPWLAVVPLDDLARLLAERGTR